MGNFGFIDNWVMPTEYNLQEYSSGRAGQLVEIINLDSGNKRIETTLQNVANGFYTYKFVFGKNVTNGKLIIAK